MNRKMKFYTVLLVVVVAMTTYAVAVTTHVTQAQLSLEPPTNPNIVINAPPVNFSADIQDRDLDIDPEDALPANGTVSMSTVGATDMDINEFPPLGVSVIIQNDTVTVTNQSVTIGNAFAAENDGDGDGDGDGDDGDSG